MAKSLNYTDSYGENYPASYWRCVQVNLCKEDKTGSALFYGFSSADAKGKRIIGQKQYSISNGDYDTYFSALSIDPEGINHVSQAYAFADSILDVDSGEKDEDDNPIMVSFFNGATNI